MNLGRLQKKTTDVVAKMYCSVATGFQIGGGGGGGGNEAFIFSLDSESSTF